MPAAAANLSAGRQGVLYLMFPDPRHPTAFKNFRKPPIQEDSLTQLFEVSELIPEIFNSHRWGARISGVRGHGDLPGFHPGPRKNINSFVFLFIPNGSKYHASTYVDTAAMLHRNLFEDPLYIPQRHTDLLRTRCLSKPDHLSLLTASLVIRTGLRD